MNQTTEAKNYICVNCKLVTNHKQKRCIQCGCQTHEQTAADVTYPADTRHEAMTPSNTEGQEPKTEIKKFLHWMAKNKICSVIPFFVIAEGRDGKVPHWTNGKKLFNADELYNKYEKNNT